MDIVSSNADGIRCAKCGVELAPGMTHVEYLSGKFTATLLRCPKCGRVFIDEALATGKAAEVQQTLEGK